MARFGRREFLATTTFVLLERVAASAGVIEGRAPWQPREANPPKSARLGPWVFFTAGEAETVEAIADRIIPPDPQTPGGKDSGCAVFIDRQLAGPYGDSEDLYTSGPFVEGTKEQGPQSRMTPAQRYRQALSDLNRYCRDKYAGRNFIGLSDEEKDILLKGLDSGSISLLNSDGKTFFKQILTDTKAGFFADPVYGGNRDMASWKMIGFPGARYDYRDWIERHNEPYPHPPVSIAGRPAWTPGKA